MTRKQKSIPQSEYQRFLDSKRLVVPSVGIEVENHQLNSNLFPFQADLVRWCVCKGRAALFADTGLGKGLMALSWAQAINVPTIMLTPLAVAQQIVREGEKFGIAVTYARSQSQADPTGITVTNYEMLEHFDVSRFQAVILDESSRLKDYTSKTRNALIEAFQAIPYRLCCSATPAPNDIQEIANHAEFLGVMTRVEMLAAFFVHDEAGWRLKGHASRGPFYKWVASWAMFVHKPSDLGYEDDGFILPPLSIEPVFVRSDYVPEGMLFATGLKGIGDRSKVRKGTLANRVVSATNLIASEPDEPWLVWTGLNDESAQMAKALPGAMEVRGSDSPDDKADALLGFAAGEIHILVTKPSIAGHGMNWQHCARMVFVGLNDSWEQYYQAIRRCWRFGQTREVKVYIVLSDVEQAIYDNVMAKEREAQAMAEELISHMAEFEKAEIAKIREDYQYRTDETRGNGWLLKLGDSAERLAELPDHSIDLSVYSPPFQSLYTYSPSDRDLGNSRTPEQFWQHFSYITRQLVRVIKPGRIMCVHVAQLTSTKAADGYIGLKDFRGATIQHMIDTGFIYHGDITVDKNPQAQAIRTHSKGLLFVQLSKDASWLRPGLADYILVFRAPGENLMPIHPDINNEDWITWAHPVWYGISETDTLNEAVARENEDERHICALQLPVIARCIRLWSNAGETVLSPFAGIGSEGYEAIRLGRQFVGCELKESYYQTAIKNLHEAERKAAAVDLFQWAAQQEVATDGVPGLQDETA